MSKQRIASNLLVMGMGQVGTLALSFVYTILTSRYLGPYRLGELTLAVAIMSVLGLVVGLGMNTLITRTVARDPERTGVITSASLIARAVLGLPAFAILYAYVHLAHVTGDTRLATYILAISMIFGSFAAAMIAAFQGHEQMALPAFEAIVQNVLNLFFALFIIWWDGGVVDFAAAGVLLALVLLCLLGNWMRRIAHLTWRIPLRDVRDVMVDSLPFWANTVFLTIYTYVDAVILGTMAEPQAVGYYGAATKLFAVPLFLPGIIATATFPMLSRLGIDPRDDFERAGIKTLSLLITCAVPITIGLATFAEPLILTIYGPSYQPAVPTLAVLSICLVPMFLNIQFAQMLMANDRPWRWTIIMCASCVLNPLANIVLIPLGEQRWHNGAVGAALALLATEILMAVYGIILWRGPILSRTFAHVVAGTVAAGLAQIAVLRLMVAFWPPMSEVLAVVVYVGAAVAVGVVPREDVMLLWDMLTVRLRRRVTYRVGPVSSTVESPPKVPEDETWQARTSSLKSTDT